MVSPKLHIAKIISGGQTGADRGGLDAAILLGIPHGGYCPRGRRAEDGSIPLRYQLIETVSTNWYERTEMNVVHAHGTIVFVYGIPPTGGSKLTLELAAKHRKPYCLIDISISDDVRIATTVEQWVKSLIIDKLNVADGLIINIAGSRESKIQGIQERVCGIMLAVLHKIR